MLGPAVIRSAIVAAGFWSAAGLMNSAVAPPLAPATIDGTIADSKKFAGVFNDN
jgi:hypothetical protein